MIDKLVVASRNKDKIAELVALLEPLGVEVTSALDHPQLEDVVEDKDTLEGNALKKARYVFEMTGIPALADDTGLEVDALGGAPGVYSARYAGENVTYQDNVDKLLRELAAKSDRSARFRTVVALVTADQEYTFEGKAEGEITLSEAGSNGFGYDPIFKPNGYDETYAELAPEVKLAISHRFKAVKAFLDFLASQR